MAAGPAGGALRLAYLYPEHLGLAQARVLQVAATVAALARQGATVHLVAGGYQGLEDRLTALGVPLGGGVELERVAMCQPGPGSRAPLSWGRVYRTAAARRLARLRRSGVRVVMTRHLKLTAWLLARRATVGLPVLYEAHELFARTAAEEGMAPAKLARLEALERAVLTGVERVVAISEPLARALEAMPGVPGPVQVTPSGVDQAFFDASGPRQRGLVAYAGGLGPWKGVDLLLEALASVPEARAVVLGGRPGSADWQRLVALAGRLELGARLEMRPRAGQDEVRRLLGGAGIAVWPGTARQRIAAEFTSPLKLFEYLAAGCAVLAPDVPAARAVLTHEADALLFRPDDPDSMAQGLRRLVSQPELTERLGGAGRAVAQGYTWDARAAKLLGVMEEMAR